jgi:hypothetical protein
VTIDKINFLHTLERKRNRRDHVADHRTGHHLAGDYGKVSEVKEKKNGGHHG